MRVSATPLRCKEYSSTSELLPLVGLDAILYWAEKQPIGPIKFIQNDNELMTNVFHVAFP
jgi:hypothetical protein